MVNLVKPLHSIQKNTWLVRCMSALNRNSYQNSSANSRALPNPVELSCNPVSPLRKSQPSISQYSAAGSKTEKGEVRNKG